MFPDAESDPDALEAKQQGILVEKMSDDEKDRDTEFQPGVQVFLEAVNPFLSQMTYSTGTRPGLAV